MQLYSEQNLRDFNNIASRLKRNSQDFIIEHHYFITLLIVAASVDAASTIYFMHTVGPQLEIHPVIRELGFILGPTLGPILGKILQITVGMSAVIYLRKYAKYILVIAAVIYSWAATANFLTHLNFH
ncbi:MAG: hypothetical protein MK132_22760 [Lentisphaerales bacterium]|nr:hypothetical protein [Lentisphaerales bacterium]